MDRRQVLVGMTAIGVAGSLNLNELLRAQSIESATKNAAARYAHMSDGERRELLGPVKICIEEGPSLVTTKEYGPDGKVVTIHMEHDGKPLGSPSDSAYSEERDAQGRILRFSSPNREGAIKETSYDYDKKTGRLLTVTNNLDSDRTVFKYTADGMTSIQTFDPKTIEETRSGAYSGSAWEAAGAAFGVPMGGSVTTIYDKSDNPIELQVHAPDGQRTTRMVRTYDTNWRLIEERTLEQNLAFLMLERFSPEQRAQLGPEGIQAFSEQVNKLLGKRPDGATYKYDSQGRVIKKCERNLFLEHTTTISYNEHGDKAGERQTFTDNTAGPEHPRDLPPDSDTRYTYQYDSYGNWTEKIETRDDGSSFTIRRTITYY